MFAVSHPLLVMIREKKIFLESIINNFPTLKSLINAEVNNNAQQIAQEIADGDKEIEQEEQSKIVNAFDDSNDLDNLFYQAMLIMVYSYYDGVVERMCKENGIKDTNGDKISKLCTLKGIELSDKTTKHKNFIFENLKSLRHDIVHNNIGTLKNSEKIYSLMSVYPEIKQEDGCVIFTGSKFILDVLNKEYEVLYELCQKLGYKTDLIGGCQ